MSPRERGEIRSGLVVPTQSIVQLIDPAVRELDGVVETFETDRAHGLPPSPDGAENKRESQPRIEGDQIDLR
jgi:hypothetical protein